MFCSFVQKGMKILVEDVKGFMRLLFGDVFIISENGFEGGDSFVFVLLKFSFKVFVMYVFGELVFDFVNFLFG